MMSNTEKDAAVSVTNNRRLGSTTRQHVQAPDFVQPAERLSPLSLQHSTLPSLDELPNPSNTSRAVELNYPSAYTTDSPQRPLHEKLHEEQTRNDVEEARNDKVNSHHLCFSNQGLSLQHECIVEDKTKDVNISVSRMLTRRSVASKETERTENGGSGSEGENQFDQHEQTPSSSSNGVNSISRAAVVTTSTSSLGDDLFASAASRDLSQDSRQHASAPRGRRPRRESSLQASSDTCSIMSDGYGLPVSMDDVIERPLGSNGRTASAVVATLPPPDSNNTKKKSSSSGGNSSGSDDSSNRSMPRLASKFPSRFSHKPNLSAHRNVPSNKPISSLKQESMHSNKKRRCSSSEMPIGKRRPSESETERGYDGEREWSPSQSSEEEHEKSRRAKGSRHCKKRKAKALDYSSSRSLSPASFMDFGSNYGYSSKSMRRAAEKMNMSSIDPAELARITLKGWLAPKPRRHRSSKKQSTEGKVDKIAIATRRTVQERNQSSLQNNYQLARQKNYDDDMDRKPSAKLAASTINGTPCGLIFGKAPLFSLSCDLMAHCMSYLEPPIVHDLLTMPLSKDWHQSFTRPQDLWRILCVTKPFIAKFEADEQDSGDESAAYPMDSELDVRHLLGRYRLLYTSFVRCMKYLASMKDDAANGRTPTVVEYGGADLNALPMHANESLKRFLARARGIVVKNKEKQIKGFVKKGTLDDPIGVNDDGSSIESSGKGEREKQSRKVPPTVKFGPSLLSARLLGPSKSGKAGNVNLPWSCAIYSIINWMVAFADVEGIQTMCLKVLPFLLEDERQRTTAPLAGLTDIVLRGMVLFPDSITLHTAAFHTIVLLARPVGGREGMLFHSSMINSSGIFNKGCQSGKNGVAVMLDSMRRFETDEVLQAMSCWSLVNIALAPSQKAVLVKLGGIEVIANAMIQHTYNAEVQFRALFALINLVIPCVSLPDIDNAALQDQLGEVNNPTEKEVLEENVDLITNLVVVAMKNFCSSEAILNRACLVLHNLSLTEEFHRTLLWTPNCYQMLEWCLANYRMDRVLQQSAGGTLFRLQTTLSSDSDLRTRFTASLQSQDQSKLESAHREALRLHEVQTQTGGGRAVN